MDGGGQIKTLTSLRFFAAFWVVLHAYWPDLAGAAAPVLVERGGLGVDLFFVLSGFILCHVYLRSVAQGGFSYGGFLWARLARIYPLHAATLAAVGVMGLAAAAAGLTIDANILSWSSLPANIFLLHAWGLAPTAGWNHPSWSISAEWFAYLAFPLFAAVALKFRHRPLLGAATAVALVTATHAVFPRLTGFPLTQATIQWGALRIVPSFALGCATNVLWRTGATDCRGWNPLVAGLAGLALLVGGQFGAPVGVMIVGFAGLILTLANLSPGESRVIAHPALVYLGEISYSIYMVVTPWQLLFVNVAAKFLHLHDKRLPIWLWVIFVAGLVPLAAASYNLIERPARRAMNLWPRRRRPHEFASAQAG